MSKSDTVSVLWDNSIIFKRHLYSGIQNLVPDNNVHTIIVLVTSIFGTPLYRGKGYFFLGPETRV